MVVEVVSDASRHKDLERLPRLYAAAGVREMWLVDARGPDLRFDVHVLGDGRYSPVAADGDGFRFSPCLEDAVRLVRQPGHLSPWRYRLEFS